MRYFLAFTLFSRAYEVTFLTVSTREVPGKSRSDDSDRPHFCCSRAGPNGITFACLLESQRKAEPLAAIHQTKDAPNPPSIAHALQVYSQVWWGQSAVVAVTDWVLASPPASPALSSLSVPFV
jgi:hypothetical protein